MIIVTGTVRIDPAELDRARPAMRAMVEASRAEDGCIVYAYAVDVLDPGLVHVIELWRDRAALTAHFQTPHMAAWRAEWASFNIRDRNLVLIEGGASEPL